MEKWFRKVSATNLLVNRRCIKLFFKPFVGIFLCLFLIFVPFDSSAQNVEVVVQLAYDTIARHKSQYDYNKWSWGAYALLTGLWRIYENTGNIDYRNHVKTYLDQFIQDNGNFKYEGSEDYRPTNPNRLSAFYLSAEMYEETGATKYLTAAKNAADHAMNNWRRTSNGGFEHFRDTKELWVDTVFMVGPFFAKMGQITNNQKYFNEATLQIIAHSNVLQSGGGLFYHAWDEDGDASWIVGGNRSPEFWGRGNGWVSAGIVDALGFLPSGHKDRPRLISILRGQLAGLADVQSPSGRWYTILDKGGKSDNYEETSASSLFLYSFKKTQDKGYTQINYSTVINHALSGILEKIAERNGKLVVNGVSQGTNPGNYDYYVARSISYNYEWGDGTALMALALFQEPPTYADKILPEANAGLDQIVDEDTLVVFDGSGSRDNVGIVSYIWTLTDVTPKTLTGVSPTYIFTTPGVYTVTLNATDAAGNWNTATITITVKDATDPKQMLILTKQ